MCVCARVCARPDHKRCRAASYVISPLSAPSLVLWRGLYLPTTDTLSERREASVLHSCCSVCADILQAVGPQYEVDVNLSRSHYMAVLGFNLRRILCGLLEGGQFLYGSFKRIKPD